MITLQTEYLPDSYRAWTGLISRIDGDDAKVVYLSRETYAMLSDFYSDPEHVGHYPQDPWPFARIQVCITPDIPRGRVAWVTPC